jgi:hypothetical protein
VWKVFKGFESLEGRAVGRLSRSACAATASLYVLQSKAALGPRLGRCRSGWLHAGPQASASSAQVGPQASGLTVISNHLSATVTVTVTVHTGPVHIH